MPQTLRSKSLNSDVNRLRHVSSQPKPKCQCARCRYLEVTKHFGVFSVNCSPTDDHSTIIELISGGHHICCRLLISMQRGLIRGCIIMPLLTLSSIAQMHDLSHRFRCLTFWQPFIQSELSFSGSQISLCSTVSPLHPFLKSTAVAMFGVSKDAVVERSLSAGGRKCDNGMCAPAGIDWKARHDTFCRT